MRQKHKDLMKWILLTLGLLLDVLDRAREHERLLGEAVVAAGEQLGEFIRKHGLAEFLIQVVYPPGGVGLLLRKRLDPGDILQGLFVFLKGRRLNGISEAAEKFVF